MSTSFKRFFGQVVFTLVSLNVMVVLLMMAAPTMAQGGGGNVPCPVGYHEFKIDVNQPADWGQSITYTSLPGSDGSLYIQVQLSADGKTLDWSANFGITYAIIKGGNATAITYDYSPWALSGTGLVSPLNAGGNVPAISNFRFCYKIEPGIRLDKVANTATVCAGKNELVTYTYTITNTGNVPLSGSLHDDNGTANGGDDFNAAWGPLAVYGSTQIQQTVAVNSTTTNTATASATFVSQTVSDQASATVVAEDCGSGQCTFTQGYWKNHPNAWTVDNLSLGNRVYSKAELLQIFAQPVKGNGLVNLAHQLIAAKLNIANGADGAALGSAIADADALINSKVVPPVGIGKLEPSAVGGLVGALDAYNNGVTGPGHCD